LVDPLVGPLLGPLVGHAERARLLLLAAVTASCAARFRPPVRQALGQELYASVDVVTRWRF